MDGVFGDGRSFSAITLLAMVLATGNLAIFICLPWRTALQGAPFPIAWTLAGLLVPLGMIVFSTYRQGFDGKKKVIERIGPYVLKEKLGSGGMGEVFLAEHHLMKRQCAVKLIHPDQARNREMRDSFAREAKATAQLTHWNTIEVYDYGTSDDGRFYYVMEYLKGVNLAQFVEQYGPMEPGRVVYILKQLCEALYESECAGLVHRDIKPSNIFLTERGRSCDVAKLLDFGLVQSVGNDPVGIKNVSTKLKGSPSYMCPEQAVGRHPDCRGDLYSLGCVAYFLLTGRPPFIDDNPIMLIVAHATSPVPKFDSVGSGVPDDLAAVVMKCLERDPKNRHASARAMLEDLEACACGHEWTRHLAERWWNEHQPCATSAAADTICGTADTTEIDRVSRDNRSAAPDEIDYNEPTLIFDATDDGEFD